MKRVGKTCAQCGQPYRPIRGKILAKAYHGMLTEQIRFLATLCPGCRQRWIATQIRDQGKKTDDTRI